MLRQGKGDHPFSTLRVNDPNLVQDLEAANASATQRVQREYCANH